jgi:hypothetical protein
MLEQAVIDAQALKEAAIKNAEQEVLDKYAGEIKEAVNSLLEQEDPMADPMADPMMDPTAIGGGGVAEPDKITDDIPMKAVEDIEDDEEEVELNLDELIKSISTPEEEEVMAAGEMAPLTEPVVAPGPAGQEMMFEVSEKEIEALLSEEEAEEEAEVDVEVNLDEEELKNTIEEILKVDLQNVPRGMAGTTHPTRLEQAYAVDVALAAEQDTETKEQTQEWLSAINKIEKLEEHVKSLKSEKNRLVKDHKELKSVARQVSNKLIELNTTNAKLVYQNRILESHSLNERQKEKLVEAVSNAKSIEEAKVIYETLQESLTFKSQKAPKNLSEAMSKNNRLVLKSNNKETQVSNSASERMKKLAGII